MRYKRFPVMYGFQALAADLDGMDDDGVEEKRWLQASQCENTQSEVTNLMI
jgi:hypothetical protein